MIIPKSNILRTKKLLISDENVFGKITKGTQENPSVDMRDVHYFYKIVSGKPNKRPWWFFDSSLYGEGITDISTHYVDIIFRLLFAEQSIDYKNDVKVHSASQWKTTLTPGQFEKVTRLNKFPAKLKPDKDGNLEPYSSGTFLYSVNGINIRIRNEWDVITPEGGGDTHQSVIKGSKAHILNIRNKETNYKSRLFVKSAEGITLASLGKALETFIKNVSGKYPGLKIENAGDKWRIDIPHKYNVGHEAHFSLVVEKFLEYLDRNPIPVWEKPNMIAKYYITTKALELAREDD